MNAHLPKGLERSGLTDLLVAENVFRIHSGKVRDSFTLPGHPDKLLVVATDRISIFDFVLNAQVPLKGEVLTAMTCFWINELLFDFPHHLVTFGAGIDSCLPPALRGNCELQRRALVVRRLEMLPVELIVRGYLTGSGWKSYLKERRICGIPLPDGYHDGSKLISPIFTPTTKAEEGHDQDIPADSVSGDFRDLAIELYATAAEYAEECGIIIADTKFEVGADGTLADEVLTPDSSRFWLQTDWEVSDEQRCSPPGFDKEPVRDWGRQVGTTIKASGKPVIGINNLRPEIASELRFVHQLTIPNEVLADTTRRYCQIFRMLTGMELQQFQQERMGIPGQY